MSNTTNNTSFPAPKVIIDRMSLEKIKYFVNKDDKECSGLGMCRVVGGTIFVDKIMMLEQRNGSAHTDIEEASVTKLMYEMRAEEGRLAFWWHSHVNMGVFWSATDLATIRQLAQQGMCVASVFNKKGEIRTAVAAKVSVPFMENEQVAIWDDLQLYAQSKIPDDIREIWDKEHADNVKAPVWSGHNMAGMWVSGGDDDWRRPSHSATTNKRPFKYVQTIDPLFWDSREQGIEFDTDWVASPLIQDRWKKSPDYMLKYNDWVKENLDKHFKEKREITPPPPPTRTPLPADTDNEKDREFYEYAILHDEIVDYDPQRGVFEFFDGTMMKASWYISDGCHEARTRKQSQYARWKAAELERLEILSKAQREHDAKTLEEDIEQQRRDMENGDVPNPNDISEQELEDMCSRAQ